jgi:hypothetical protein
MAGETRAKKQKKAMPMGMRGAHYGFRVGDYYLTPSQFALAWIGVNSPGKLERILDEQVEKILKGELRREDTPYFHDAVLKAESEKRRFSLDDLRAAVKEVYGTAKMIDREAVLALNKKQSATASYRDTVSIKIDSRWKRTERGKRDAQNVTLYNPFFKNLDELASFYFEGGSLHAQKGRARLSPFSRRLKQDRLFLEYLAGHVERLSKKWDYRISASDVRREFERPVKIVDYHAAAGLIALSMFVRESPSKVKGMHLDVGEQTLLPFDFDNAPQYAFEAFLRAYISKRGKPSERRVERRLFGIDTFLVGKKGFVTQQFRDAQREGIATKEVYIAGRHFPDHSGAIIQALTEHFYEKERKFAGFPLEFAGTDYQTISIAFENRRTKDQYFDARIIFDNNLGLPYVMYKRRLPNPEKIIPEGLSGHPLSQLNWAKGVTPGRKPLESWTERDAMTGYLVQCEIYEVDKKYLRRAEQLSLNAGGRGTTAYALKGRYIGRQQEFKRTGK